MKIEEIEREWNYIKEDREEEREDVTFVEAAFARSNFDKLIAVAKAAIQCRRNGYIILAGAPDNFLVQQLNNACEKLEEIEDEKDPA